MQPTVTLNNGIAMPLLGFGTYQIAPQDTEHCVTQAIETGYRLIDTAQNYGNESGVGRAVAQSGIDRREFFITTKIQHNGYQAAKRSIEESLERLQSDYVDLLLIHWSFPDNDGIYRAMIEAYESGKTRAIGLSNFYGRDLTEIIENHSVMPAVNQVETHVFYQQKDMLASLNPLGIRLQAWSPLAAGRNRIFQHPVLTDIAQKHGKSIAQVCLRFLIQQQICVFPKSTNKVRMQENFNLFDFSLDSADMTNISELDTGKGLFGWP